MQRDVSGLVIHKQGKYRSHEHDRFRIGHPNPEALPHRAPAAAAHNRREHGVRFGSTIPNGLDAKKDHIGGPHEFHDREHDDGLFKQSAETERDGDRYDKGAQNVADHTEKPTGTAKRK